MEYDVLQPFGDERANWHAALIAQIVAAAHTPRGRRPPSLSDFMYRDAETRRRERTQKADEFFGRISGRG